MSRQTTWVCDGPECGHRTTGYTPKGWHRASLSIKTLSGVQEEDSHGEFCSEVCGVNWIVRNARVFEAASRDGEES